MQQSPCKSYFYQGDLVSQAVSHVLDAVCGTDDCVALRTCTDRHSPNNIIMLILIENNL